MPYVMQDVVDRARLPLEDDDKDRYSDDDLLAYGTAALQMLRIKRPDLFFGLFESEPNFSALAIGEAFPLGDEYMQPVADYITGRASTHDADHVVSGRVKLFFEFFGMTT